MTTSSPLSLRLGAESRSVDPPLLSPSRPASKRKGNDLLRNYYGLGDTAATSTTVSPSSTSANRLDTDSDTFDAQLAFQTLLQEKGLSQLLKHESDLLTEIRELDGERQSLVYNHHHELVSATETIGKMKDQADALSPNLLSLRTSLRDISQSLQEVRNSPTALDGSKSIQQVSLDKTTDKSLTSASLQKILAPAVELPERLKSIILLEKTIGLEKARGVWGSMEAVLATWDEAGIPGAKDIMIECRHVLREAQQQQQQKR